MSNTIKPITDNTKAISIGIDIKHAEIINKLKQTSTDTGTPMGAIVVSALDLYLSQQTTCCGVVYAPDKKFCHQCGKALGKKQEKTK